MSMSVRQKHLKVLRKVDRGERITAGEYREVASRGWVVLGAWDVPRLTAAGLDIVEASGNVAEDAGRG